MLKGITRGVSREVGRCELAFREREPVDYERAVRQHSDYCELLRGLGLELISLEACDSYPDCCFVADTAVVLDEVAIITNPGAASRRGEIHAIEKALSERHEVVRLGPNVTLDGGDVLRLGRHLFVGRSTRTGAAGITALARIVRPLGYTVTPVRVTGSLHLTTACSALDDETVLANPAWADVGPFSRYHVLTVPEDEPWSANTMRVGRTVCVESGAPRTLELVARHCDEVSVLDISEFRKAEGSLSCLSIIFNEADSHRLNRNKEAIHGG